MHALLLFPKLSKTKILKSILLKNKNIVQGKQPLITCYHLRARGGGGGVVGYTQTLPIRVCAAQWCRDFKAPDLEWGIHFRGVF